MRTTVLEPARTATARLMLNVSPVDVERRPHHGRTVARIGGQRHLSRLTRRHRACHQHWRWRSPGRSCAPDRAPPDDLAARPALEGGIGRADIATDTSRWELAQPRRCGLSQLWGIRHHADVRSRLRGLDLDFGPERRSELRSVVFPHHDEAAQEVVAPTRILYFNAFHLGRVNSRPFVYRPTLAAI